MLTTFSQPNKNFLTVLMIGLFGLFLVQCQTNSDSSKDDTVKTELNQEDIREDLESLKSDIQAKIDEIDREIDRIDEKIESRAETAGENIRSEWSQTRETLVQWRDELKADLDEASEVTKDNWAEFKSDADESMEKVEEAFKTFGDKMKDAFTPEG